MPVSLPVTHQKSQDQEEKTLSQSCRSDDQKRLPATLTPTPFTVCPTKLAFTIGKGCVPVHKNCIKPFFLKEVQINNEIPNYTPTNLC